MENVKRICWDCPNEPVTDWKVNNVKNEEKDTCLQSLVQNVARNLRSLAGWLVVSVILVRINQLAQQNKTLQ